VTFLVNYMLTLCDSLCENCNNSSGSDTFEMKAKVKMASINGLF